MALIIFGIMNAFFMPVTVIKIIGFTFKEDGYEVHGSSILDGIQL